MELNKSIKGVTCHSCRDWIMPGRMYYKEWYQDYQIQKYRNHCMKCATKETMEKVLEYGKVFEGAKRKAAEYKKDNKTICSRCKDKFKHVVGDCNPLKDGCRPKLEINNDNKKSKKK
jgi:hypothetical protein